MNRASQSTEPAPARSPIRTAVVRLTIVSFSVAALLGIIALLAGDTFGTTEARVLLTTLLVGVVSVAVLCYLSTGGTPYQVVGVLGGVAVLAPFVTGLLLIWSDWETAAGDVVVEKTFGVGTVVAATLAQASLLLSLGRRARGLLRGLLFATLGLAIVVAALVSALILGWVPDDDFTFARVLGVAAILDVLGTVVVSALSKFGPAAGRGAREVTLPADLAARVDEEAARRGRTRDAVVADALSDYLGSGRSAPPG